MQRSNNKKKKNKKKNNKNKKLGGAAQSNVLSIEAFQLEPYTPSSAAGCYVISSHSPPDWIFGVSPFRRSDYGLGPNDTVPDMSLDPEEGLLTCFNSSSSPISLYISTTCPCLDAFSRPLQPAPYVDPDGVSGLCVTLIILLSPLTSIECVRLVGSDLVSHISRPHLHPSPLAFDPLHVIPFPLQGPGPYLCSQSHGGALTHFSAPTRHAVDLDCPLGTPVLACGDGTIVEAKAESSCRGPWAMNLFHWNSLMIQLENPPLVVEYVHIAKGSIKVQPGQKVARGDVLCLSGDVGFCPTPHLHVQCHTSTAPDAQTVRFAFQCEEGQPFFPKCGCMYSPKSGQVK